MHNFTPSQVAEAIAKLVPPTYIATHTELVGPAPKRAYSYVADCLVPREPSQQERVFFQVFGTDPFGRHGGRGKLWNSGQALRDDEGLRIDFVDMDECEAFGKAVARERGWIFASLYSPAPVAPSKRGYVREKSLLPMPMIGMGAVDRVHTAGLHHPRDMQHPQGRYERCWLVRALVVLDPEESFVASSANVLKVLYESRDPAPDSKLDEERAKAHRLAEAFDQSMRKLHGRNYFQRYYPAHCD